jgi:DNA-binding MarR family transcriptional regulator
LALTADAHPEGRGVARTGLQQEIKKRLPFEVAEQEAALNVIRTADRLGLAFARLFRCHGLTGPQYNILRILRGVGVPGLASMEIAGRLLTCVPDITRLVDRLEAGGLAARERSADDRRVVHVRVMPRGLRLLEKLDAPVIALHRQLLGHLKSNELAELSRLCVKARSPD